MTEYEYRIVYDEMGVAKICKKGNLLDWRKEGRNKGRPWKLKEKGREGNTVRVWTLRNGVIHRSSHGPAIEWSDGRKAWMVMGRRVFPPIEDQE